MDSNKIYSFQPKPFFLIHAFIILLMASWIYPATRAYWNAIDLMIFQTLNGTLRASDGTIIPTVWNAFWALLNIRLSDFIPLGFMLILLTGKGITFPEGTILKGLIGFICLLALMLILREGVVDTLIDYFGWGRSGPTEQIDSTIRLTSLYPDNHPKDNSTESFPGDHASVLIVWLGYSLYHARNRWTAAIIATVIFFSLPRLFSGAHWFSDVMVGGVTVAFLALAWGLYTPLLNPLISVLYRCALWFLGKARTLGLPL